MLAETTDFADYVIRHGDGRLETLLTAPFSIIEGPLYELYGVAATTSPNGDPTTPLDESQRAGILTHASVMAAQAHSEQTSPVLRGLFVRQSLLCQPMPPPPADVNNTPPPPDPNATTKERFNEHTQDPACAGCHLLIDPVGWGFEQYDAIGRYRTMEGSNPVDARGEITGTADADGEFDGAVELAQLLAGSEQVGECVAKQWFRFAFGRSEVEEDTCSIATTHSLFADAGYDIRELLLTIVVSDTFRHRRLSQ
jgi:hypothetical protein